MTTSLITAFLLISQAGMLQQANPQQAAQPAAQRKEKPPEFVRVYRIEHAHLDDVSEALRKLARVTSVRDARTNSLLIRGSEEQFVTVEQIITSLDQPTKDQSDSLRVFEIRNRDTQELARRLSELYRTDLRVSADTQGHRLLIRGTQADLDASESILAKLDRPLPSATVHFAFFLLSDTGAQSEVIGPLPPDLQDVAEELLRFGSPKLIGRTMTASVENEEFQVAGQVADESTVDVSCRLTSAAKDGAVVMQIRAELAVEEPKKELDGNDPAQTQRQPRRQRRNFSIGTTVTAPRGDYVILGGAPHGYEPGQSVVLVVHVPK